MIKIKKIHEERLIDWQWSGKLLKEVEKIDQKQKIHELWRTRMELPRKQYLEKLIRKKDNGRIKVITGIRRCGKSYLLLNLYRTYLLETGVKEDQIISLALDELQNARYRNPFELDRYIREKIRNSSIRYYVFIDELQCGGEGANP